MIYTSYFSNYRNFPNGSRLVSIARETPKNFNGEVFSKLAPDKNLLKSYKEGKFNSEMYTKIFNKYLSSLNKESVRSFLDSNCTILLCYEKPDDFCHRHLVAEWLGEDVKEL